MAVVIVNIPRFFPSVCAISAWNSANGEKKALDVPDLLSSFGSTKKLLSIEVPLTNFFSPTFQLYRSIN